MFGNRNFIGFIARGLIVTGFMLVMSGFAFCQDYYVDAENGDDWNSGSPSAPWKTVNFALTGPHAPLPADSTIHLYGTNGVSYGVGNGDSFPWVLYSNMSVVADNTGGSGSDWIVDASGSGQNIIELHPNSQFPSSVIQGIEDVNHLYDLILRGGARGIVMEPVGIAHAPTIKYCKFENMSAEGIRIVGNASATVAPLISDNIFDANSGNQIRYEVPGCQARGTIEDNVFSSGGGHGIYLTGIPSGGGTTVITGNDISGNADGYSGLRSDSFTGKVECINNTINCRDFAINISSCDPWDQDSKVEDNHCTANDTHNSAIYISNTDDVTLRGNTGIGGGSGTYSCYYCIYIKDSDRAIVDNNVCSSAYSSCVYLSNAKDAVLTNNVCETAETNHGIYLDNSDRTVLESNSCFSSAKLGIYVYNGSSEVIIRQNDCFSNGTWGVNVSGSSDVEVFDNTLTSNNTGGLYVGSTGAQVFENTIMMNGGTGIQDATCDDSSYICNLVAKNGGDGIVLSASSSTTPPKIYHNTVAYNNGDGIWTALSSTTDPYVVNCIFWGSGGLDMSGLAYGQYYHCCAWSGISPGNGNIHADPLFVDAANDDYHLTDASPCIDAGLNAVLERANDLDGIPRVLNGDWIGTTVTDMGTFEYTEVALALSGTFQQGTVVDVTVTGPQLATFGVYAAVNIASFPVGAHPGFLHFFYGTVLFDISKLFSFTPILSGQLDSNGTATVQLNLPVGSAGRCVVLQAAIDHGTGGQFTNAEKFAILK